RRLGLSTLLDAVRPGAARLLLGLARANEDRGEHAKARQLYERALQIIENGRGVFSSEKLRLRALHGLATLERIDARYEVAEAHFGQAIGNATTAFGRRHLETATLLNNLAVVHKYQGRFVEAKRLYLRSLAIIAGVLGPHHPHVATIYHNLGGLEHARGRFER